MSYAKALEKLESLPPDEQELASGMYVFELRDGKPHCGCAIGKLLTEELRAELAGCNVNHANVTRLKTWLNYDNKWAPLSDMTHEELRDLQAFNDGAEDESNSEDARRERYRLVIYWLRKRVAAEVAP